MIRILPYKGNRKALIKFLEDLQDHVISIDPLNRFVRLPQYGEQYADEILDKVETQNGIILFADHDGTSVGLIVGIIEEVPERDLLECIPSKMGTILQLIVDAKHRGSSIGSLLMSEIEAYFKMQGCDVIYAGTLAVNERAVDFYRKQGYNERIIEMMKKIS